MSPSDENRPGEQNLWKPHPLLIHTTVVPGILAYQSSWAQPTHPVGTRTMGYVDGLLCVVLLHASRLVGASAGVEKVYPVDLEWKVRG